MGSYFDTLTKDDEKKKKEKSYSYFDTQPTVRKKEPVKVDPKILASQERYKALRQQKIPSTKTISHIIPALKDTFKSSIGLDDTQFPEGMGLWEKFGYFRKELAPTVKTIAKEYAKAPARVLTTLINPWLNAVEEYEGFYDTGKFPDGMSTIEKTALTLRELPTGIKSLIPKAEKTPVEFPGLGEAPSAFKSYEHSRSQGDTPFIAGLKTGSQVAMDFAITLGLGDYFMKKSSLKVAEGEVVASVSPQKQLNFIKPLKGHKPIVKQAKYYEFGKGKVLSVTPTKQGTLLMNGYNMSNTQFQNNVNSLVNMIKKVGITTKKPFPTVKSVSIPKTTLQLMRGAQTAPPVSPTPIVVPPVTPAVQVTPQAKGAGIIGKVGEPKTLDVYNGSNNEVIKVTKDFERYHIIDTDQHELIDLFAKDGDLEAQSILEDKDFYVKADKFLRDKFKGEIEAIQYNNEHLPQKGVEYFDLSEGKFYSENKAVAEAYSLQSRGAKYEAPEPVAVKKVTPTQPLAKEALKYDSAEEFVNSFRVDDVRFADSQVVQNSKLLNKPLFRVPIEDISLDQRNAAVSASKYRTTSKKVDISNKPITLRVETGAKPGSIAYSSNGNISIADGNHRIAQAIRGGDTNITAFFEGKAPAKYGKGQTLTDIYNKAKGTPKPTPAKAPVKKITTPTKTTKKGLVLEAVQPKPLTKEGIVKSIKKGADSFADYLEENKFRSENLVFIKPTKAEYAEVQTILEPYRMKSLGVTKTKFPAIGTVKELEEIAGTAIAERIKKLYKTKTIDLVKSGKFDLKKVGGKYILTTTNGAFIEIPPVKEEVKDGKVTKRIKGEDVEVPAKPLITKAKLKSLFSLMPDLRANPLFTVKEIGDAETKVLSFKGKTQEINIKPSALGLVEENLKVGEKIKIDLESLKLPDSELRINKYIAGTGGGSTYAEKGGYAEIPLTSRLGNIQMPEMVKLAKSLLGGKVPFLKRYPSSYGMFYGIKGNPEIGLNPEIFKDPDQASKTLAHELGHLIDFRPTGEIQRGNLLNRLEVLKDIRGGIIGDQEIIAERQKALRSLGYYNNLKNPSEAQLAKRDAIYDKLEELNKKLVIDKEYRAELKKLTQYWKPFDEKRVPASFKSYRYSSVELYADFVSVLFNKPEVLLDIAPKFYNRFFEYIDKKPLVAKKYFELMDMLSGSTDSILDAREADLVGGMRTAKEIELGKMAEPLTRSIKEKSSRLVRTITETLLEKNIDFLKIQQDAMKKGLKIDPDKNPAVMLEELDLISNEISDVFDKIEPVEELLKLNDLTDEDMSLVLFFNRVLGDRKDFANPFGHNPTTAQAGLERLRTKWGAKKFTSAMEAVNKFQSLYKAEFKIGFEGGLYNAETFQKLYNSKDVYATFKVIDHLLDGFVSSRVLHQIGTLKDIGNVYQSTVAKMVAIRISAIRNQFRTEGANLLVKTVPSNELVVAKIDPQTGNARDTILSKEGKRLNLITWREVGKLKGIYVDPHIAQSFRIRPMLENRLIQETVGFMNNKILRKAYIDYSIRFIVRNPIRDLKQAYKALSLMDLQGTGKFKVRFVDFARAIKNAYPDARLFAKGEKTDTMKKILDSKILGTDMDFKMKKSELDDATAIEREMMKRHLKLSNIKKKGLPNPIDLLGSFIQQVGQTNEAITKITAYKLINERLQKNGLEMDKETSSYIRNNIGTPNWRKGGTLTPATNTLFMFSNVMLQGYRRTANLITSPNTRSGYAWRTASIAVLPKILMWLGTVGAFGVAIKKMYDKISEYKKQNYLVMPLGEHNGKTVSLSLPMDYDEKLLTSVIYKALDGINAQIQGIDEKKLGFDDIFDLLSSEMPTLTNTLLLPSKWAQFLKGQNPMDNFRGYNVLTDKEREAGGVYALEPMLKWSWNQIFSSIIKVKVRDRVRKETTLEKIARLPGINAFIDISDYGVSERSYEITKDIKQAQARRNMEKDKAVFSAVREYIKGDKEVPEIISDLEKTVYGGQSVEKSKIKSLHKRFVTDVLKSYNNAYLTSLIYATTNEEKEILIRSFKSELEPDELNHIGKILTEAKILSVEVWNKAIK